LLNCINPTNQVKKVKQVAKTVYIGV